jgi:translation elongation factor EF-1alpha
VQGLELDGSAVEWGFAGDNLDVGITGVELSSLAIGDVVCDPQKMVMYLLSLRARIVDSVEVLKPAVSGSHGFEIRSADCSTLQTD